MLQWQHDWGTKTEHFERMLELGDRVPRGFANRPDVLPVSAFYWAAFCDLESERAFGMAAGPIPRSKARDYALEHGIDDSRRVKLIGLERMILLDTDALADFLQIIVRLDNAASKIRRPRAADEPEYRDKVSMKDTAGVKNLMRNLSKKPRK